MRLCLFPVLMICNARAQGDSRSIVDYLKARGQDSSLSGRRALYERTVPGRDRYRGTSAQNRTLLRRLLQGDRAALAAGAASMKGLARIPSTGGRVIEKKTTALRWIPAMGFGVNGTFSVRVGVRIKKGRVKDQDFTVSVFSPSGQLGRLSLAGSVEVFIGGVKKPSQRFRLSRPWFMTIGPADSRHAFAVASRGTSIKIQPGKTMRVRVTVTPTVATRSGLVSLQSESVEFRLDR